MLSWFGCRARRSHLAESSAALDKILTCPPATCSLRRPSLTTGVRGPRIDDNGVGRAYRVWEVGATFVTTPAAAPVFFPARAHPEGNADRAFRFPLRPPSDESAVRTRIASSAPSSAQPPQPLARASSSYLFDLAEKAPSRVNSSTSVRQCAWTTPFPSRPTLTRPRCCRPSPRDTTLALVWRTTVHDPEHARAATNAASSRATRRGV